MLEKWDFLELFVHTVIWEIEKIDRGTVELHEKYPICRYADFLHNAISSGPQQRPCCLLAFRSPMGNPKARSKGALS